MLTYHDITPQKSVWFDTTPNELREQLLWLKSQGATFVTYDQLRAHLTEWRPIPRRAVLITFSDNYRGVYDYGQSILRELEVPSVMFVHTGFVGSEQGRPKMSWDQLRELRDGIGMAVQSQTVSHPRDLTRMRIADRMTEFTRSKASIESNLNQPVTGLAYPNGKWDRCVAENAKSAGYEIAFTEAQRPAQTAESLWSIPRYVHTKYREAWQDANP